MARRALDGDQRLRLVVETERRIVAAGDDLPAINQIVVDSAQSIIGADGAMTNLIDGEMLRTRATSGIARRPLDERRPIAESVGRFAIDGGEPVLVTDARTDPRINQRSRAAVGAESLLCVPMVRGAEVIGTLNVFSADAEDPLDEADQETLELLSVVLSSAVSHAAELEARQAEAEALARFQTLFDGASIGIMRLDCAGQVHEANPALEQMLGQGLVGARFIEHLVGSDQQAMEQQVSEMAAGRREAFDLEGRCRPSSGELIWCHLRAVLERDPDGTPVAVIAMIEDISERKHAEEELIHQSELNQHQALHDPLTGLPNRVLFGERIGQAIRHARRTSGQLAVMLMDLDRFKEVNDSLGHPAGDQLLVSVSERIRGALRESDTFARLGGDEFGLLLPELTSAADIEPVLARIDAALEQPITVHTLPLAVEASIGVALFPDHGEDAQTLIQRADVAMYEAKRDSATACVYSQGSYEVDVNRLTLVGELRRAMERDELVLHYQPKACLENGEVRSVEALVRWNHPERGMIFPDAFIPIAQETSLIGPFTLHVLAIALRQGHAWRAQGLDLAISVNLSMRNLLDRELPRRLEEMLERFQMPASALELEVTESSMLANPKRAKVVLSELSELGVRLSIDDFGTGFSSLSYLRELPVDEIKIDRSFVMRMTEQSTDVAIVRSTIDLGRNLGLDVVAEGVETREIWDKLLELGCRTAQGYYLSRPVAPEALTEWLTTRGHSLAA
jgi:diguanylate cyclase (GGDEF)-like protein/PAS domain S-box-containing protein